MRHNTLAIVVVVILHHVLGFLWYGPLFMKPWAAAHKLDVAAMRPSAGPFIVTLVCSILATYVMSWLIQRLGIKDGAGGLRLAVIIWFGFALTAIWPHYAFPGLPFSLVAIDAGNALVAMLISGYVLGAWQPK